MARELRRGVGEAVAEVQAGAVPPLAVPPIGVDGGPPVILAKGNDREVGFQSEQRQNALAVGSDPGRQNNSRLRQRGRSDPGGRGVGELVEKRLPAGLLRQDGDQRRAVENQTPPGP